MKNLKDMNAKLDALKADFESKYETLRVVGGMDVSEFAQLTLPLVEAIVALEKVIKELSSGMYSFNADNTVSVTYLSHFVGGKFQHDAKYKTVKFSFIDCLRNLKHLNVNKHVLMTAIF